MTAPDSPSTRSAANPSQPKADSAHDLDECDLVMKGGVTSGVIYPKAIVRLSQKYRFRRFGGSSAGAIAAVLAAAAEYGRQHGNVPSTGPTDELVRRSTSKPPIRVPAGPRQTPSARPESGFAGLSKVPGLLEDQDLLLRLFQPAPQTAAAFRLVMAAIAPLPTAQRVLRCLWVVMRSAWVVFLVAFLLALLPGLATSTALDGHQDWSRIARSMLVWLPGTLLVSLTAATITTLVRALRRLRTNGFGLTVGHNPDVDAGKKGASPGLTDWLTDQIDAIAGKNDGAPLTFGDLWGDAATTWYCTWREANVRDSRNANYTSVRTPESTRASKTPRLTDLEWLSANGPNGKRPRLRFDPEIDLKVMTTCLTTGMPFAFPFSDDTFFYCHRCFQGYFPSKVMQHLEDNYRDADLHDPREPHLATTCPLHPDSELRKLPLLPDIPIVIAARLSLSFPLLITAIPLYYVDFGLPQGKRSLVTAWFSDGGIASNFPMHFFDAVLPKRPTFGINLGAVDERYSHEPIYIPPSDRPVLPRERPIGGIRDFLVAVVGTMQNWPDNQQVAAPGVRDRVVHVFLPKKVGGLNLQMNRDQITSLADLGDHAGRELVETFKIDEHRWVRFRVVMAAVRVWLERFRHDYPSFAPLLRFQGDRPYRLGGRAQRASRLRALGLVLVARAWRDGQQPSADEPPRPEPSLRIGPRR